LGLFTAVLEISRLTEKVDTGFLLMPINLTDAMILCVESYSKAGVQTPGNMGTRDKTTEIFGASIERMNIKK
jgi:hypothetical protein